jgi:hypothetical protein
MAGTETWAGWIRFGAIILMIIATLDFFQGLIAVIRSEYYVLAPNQIIVFDTTTWGWITIIWAIILFITGLGLGQGASWARWTTIVVCSLGFLVQLGFVGSAAYPLWALTVVAFYLIVLYAIVVRWDDAGESVRRTAESRM